MKKLLTLCMASLMSFSLVACGNKPQSTSDETKEAVQTKEESTNSDVALDEVEGKDVVIEMEDGEKIVIELDPESAPETVKNFETLVLDGFYDGLIFHRVIKGFMIQGGDPTGTGTGGADKKIVGEFKSNGIENNLSHVRGVISMARSSNPNSASSQFFIVHEDSTFLDGDYAAFGKVIEGMDVVDKIANVETDRNDKPTTPVVMKHVYFEE